MKKTIAIICHFSNQLIRTHLELRQGRFYKYGDNNNWITNIINSLKGREDLQLHVISPYPGMKKSRQEFEIEGVSYHFFSSCHAFPWGFIEDHLRLQSLIGFRRNRKRVMYFIKKIKPDLVNLIGAENAYYAISALDIDNIPIILHCQTVYANPDRKKNAGHIDKVRWDVEIELFRKTPYMALTGRMYYDLVKGYNPNAIIFPRRWPASRFPTVPNVEKKYDFVYWARYLNRNKGFDNAIEAMAKFAIKHPEVKLLAIGKKDHDWPMFESRIKKVGLEDKLEIHAPFREYTELLKYVRQSRFALLPITMDVLSGTILEALRMGMPVVTCRTSGTPSLNEKRETVLISDIGDSERLSQNMLKLYENSSLQERLRNNGFAYIEEKDKENEKNADIMVEQYMAVIEHYRHGTPIPMKLLYNIEENKDYRKNENN